MTSSANNLEGKVQEILQKTEIIASVQHPLESLAEPYPIGDDRPFGYQSTIDLLQKQLLRESENGWKFACLPRIYTAKPVKEENGDTDAMNGVEKIATKHAFPALTIPINMED